MFKKGQSGNPKGKIKGTENNITRDIKEAYRMLIEKNIDNISIWLDDIAQESPEKAFYILMSLTEYVIPKLARTDASVKVESNEFEEARKKFINGLKNDK